VRPSLASSPKCGVPTLPATRGRFHARPPKAHRRSLQWLKLPGEREGRWTERPPKAKSKRDLPLTETLYRSIVRHIGRRQHEAETSKCWNDSGYLFTSVTGAPLHPRNILEAFHLLCDAAQVPRVRVHDTRHSCATILHAQGASPFIIQQVLGHSQLSTTRRYTHIPIAVTKAAITGVESAFEATKKKQDDEKEKAAEAKRAEPVPGGQTLRAGPFLVPADKVAAIVQFRPASDLVTDCVTD
jgi:hypothetical protein